MSFINFLKTTDSPMQGIAKIALMSSSRPSLRVFTSSWLVRGAKDFRGSDGKLNVSGIPTQE